MAEKSEIAEILRKMGLFGVGMFYLTKEKIEELTAEMMKKGDISKEEAKAFVREFVSAREKQMAEIDEKINSKIKDATDKGEFVMKSDLEALQKKIDKLEKIVQGKK